MGLDFTEEILQDISVCRSRGYGRNGRLAVFIRPAGDCRNKSRRVSGFTNAELNEKIISVAKKWYFPIRYYKVDGQLIGSNNAANALKEYWRFCEKDYIGQIIPVSEKEP